MWLGSLTCWSLVVADQGHFMAAVVLVVILRFLLT